MVEVVEMVDMVDMGEMVEMVEIEKMESSRFRTGPVAQWIRHRPTEPGIAGLSPAGVILSQVLADCKVECQRVKGKRGRKSAKNAYEI